MSNKIKDIIPLVSDSLRQLFQLVFLSSQNISIGLDIGRTYVKAVSLEKRNQAINITGFSCEKIETGTKDAITKALSNLSTQKKELTISISGQNVALRYVNLPLMNQEELTKSMDFEIEKYVPFKKDEINFDFTILKENKNTNKMLVLIAAAKKDLVDNHIKLCKGIGYQTNFIDVCPIAISNYFEFAGGLKEGVYAVVNLGAAATCVDIIENGLLVLSRDIFIGGNDFTKKISELVNKDFKQAEEIKLKSLDDDLILSLEPIFNNLARELKASFDFYETQENRLIDRILITGGSAQIKGIIDVFKHSLGENIELLTFNSDKFKINPSLNFEEFKNNFNFFTIALGMALRSL